MNVAHYRGKENPPKEGVNLSLDPGTAGLALRAGAEAMAKRLPAGRHGAKASQIGIGVLTAPSPGPHNVSG